MSDPEETGQPSPNGPDDAGPSANPSANPNDDDDCYWDGPYLVFTEAYHLKRGYCCNSGCRHCPWKDTPSPLPGS